MESGNNSEKKLTDLFDTAVKVQRSNGSIEDDWTLKSIGNQHAVVEKLNNSQGEILRKLIPVSNFSQLNNLDAAKVENFLAKQQLKKSIQILKHNFEEAAKLKRLKVIQGVRQQNEWQQIVFGEGISGKDEEIYRGYLMIEPEDFPAALNILMQVAEERHKKGMPSEFKWLMRTGVNEDREKNDLNYRPTEIGDYSDLKPYDPRIAIYGHTLLEIRSILEALARNEKWQAFEINRNKNHSAAGPRRPGTNLLVYPEGREWRTLNYNDVPGFSENEALDENWRNKKIGIRTSDAKKWNS